MAGPGLNKVTLIGNLGADPERRRTQTGLLITNLNIATNEIWFDKDTQEKKERTEWHRVVFFGKTAELILDSSLHKGSKAYVEGRLQTRKWQDQEGNDRYTTEIIGRDFIFLDRVEGGRAPEQHSDPFESEPARAVAEKTTSPETISPDSDLDDDIPW